jgi:ABC-type transport system involved in cytochrome c biogenesis permease subunit
MSVLEGAFLWAAVALYVLSLLLSLTGGLFRWPRGARVGDWTWPLAVALLLAAGLTRWVVTGHAPVMYAYENSLAGSFFIALIYLLLERRFALLARGRPAAITAVLLLLGNGLMAPASLTPLEPPFRSGWLGVHVLFAWVGFGSFVVASILAGLYLRKESPVVDDLAGRLVALGFAGHTVMLASGAIWAHGLWGRYWAWDPVETWSLLTWLIYGANLHLRFTLGWRGRRAAWLTLVSVVAVVVTFFGLGVVSEAHTEILGRGALP